jgi:hypothetical protein
MQTNCYSYSYSPTQLFFPQSYVYKTLCGSADKTYIFIVTIINIMIYWIIYQLIDKSIDSKYKYFILIPLIILIIIILICLIIIVAKKPVYASETNTNQEIITTYNKDTQNILDSSY